MLGYLSLLVISLKNVLLLYAQIAHYVHHPSLEAGYSAVSIQIINFAFPVNGFT